MQPDDKNKIDTSKDQQQNVAANTASGNTNADENVFQAHIQAEKDIEQDPDLSIHSPNDDLDEGETARLGEDTTDII